MKGICHFIGGAFGGAIPQLVYPSLLAELASNGYTTIATPFPVTFKHKECSESLRDRFEDVLLELRGADLSDLVPEDVPVHGIGHSFGALAHSLIGCSDQQQQVESNVLISFNNKEVEAAIPIPGFLPALRLAFQAYDQSPIKLLQSPVPIVKTLAKEFVKQVKFDASLDGLIRRTIDNGLDQVNSVFEEIQQGIVNFEPVPGASAELIKKDYKIPNTLLVKFKNDSIDETLTLYNLMTSSPTQSTSLQTIKGTHLTPCVGDLRWLEEVLKVKLDEELIEFIQKEAQIENKNFNSLVIDWLNSHS